MYGEFDGDICVRVFSTVVERDVHGQIRCFKAADLYECRTKHGSPFLPMQKGHFEKGLANDRFTNRRYVVLLLSGLLCHDIFQLSSREILRMRVRCNARVRDVRKTRNVCCAAHRGPQGISTLAEKCAPQDFHIPW